ncbi:MAG: hypothetical protein CMO55_12245 [Verrucomicrobiales bacterium]|nr:hypothetical protein [Verrucomicrobiales bacterium]
MKKKPQSRHGVRAKGKTQTSISLREDLLNRAKEAAEGENRSFSNWLENLLAEKLREEEEKKKSS